MHIPETSKWINTRGETYCTKTEKISRSATVKTKFGTIRTEKAVLWTFKGEPPRGGSVIHINGNNDDFTPGNMKYTTLEDCRQTEKVNNENLYTALRCYLQVERKYKPRLQDIITKTILRLIVDKRKFAPQSDREPVFDVLTVYLDDWSATSKIIAEKQNITVRDARTIIAKYINQLTGEIIADLNAGKLEIQPFAPTKRELRKKETVLLHEFGLKRYQIKNELSKK